MSTAARKVVNYSLVAGAPGADELESWSFEKRTADPAAPANGQEWVNTTDARRRWRGGTVTHTYAHLTDVTNVWKSRGVHNTNALPTAATATINANAPLVNYNTFLMTNATPVTIAGIQGSTVLHAGDVLVLVDDAAPATAASWVGIQRNLADGDLLIPINTAVATLPADTDTAVTLTGLTTVTAYEVEDANGFNIKDLIICRRSAANQITLTSSVAFANITIRAIGVA